MARFLRRLVARFRYRGYANDLAEELRAHHAMAQEDLERSGSTSPEADHQARRALGNELKAREDARAVWIAPRLDHCWQDIRFAVRQIRRAPAFALTAIAMSGLGVGALTAVFSLVNAVWFLPLPYPGVDRVLALATADSGSVDGITFHAAKERTRSIATIAAQRSGSGWSLAVGDHAEYVESLRVSQAFFGVVGVTPAIGRAFSAAEDSAGGADAVVVSHDVWERVFLRRPDAIGQVVTLGGTPHEVVGVMPQGFHSIPPADVWTPLRLASQDNSVNYAMLARLAPSATMQQATTVLDLVKADLLSTQPERAHARIRSLQWLPLHQLLGREPLMLMLLLLVAVTAVVIVACTNLAGLQLLRTVARRHEMATRLALGGGSGRIVQQVLTEALVLAAIGGAAGVVVAAISLPVLTQFTPAELLAGRRLTIDGRVLGFALAVTASVALLFGLAPAMAARRVDLRSALSDGARQGSSRTGSWWRRGLLTGQLAATMALLVLAGMLVNTIARMYRAELGFDPSNVTVGKMALQGRSFEDAARVAQLVEGALARVRDVPGVLSVAVANHVPVERGLNMPLDVPLGSRISQTRSVDWRYVTPEYFELLRIAVRQGRPFAERDGAGAPPVAIVSEAFVRVYFGEANVLGRSISLVPQMKDTPREIVGVVADVRSRPGAGWTRGFSALGADPPPIVYVPLAQVPPSVMSIAHRAFPATWLVRTATFIPDLDRQIATAVMATDPSVAFVRFMPMTQLVADDVGRIRLMASAISVFATLAILIACIGVYGLVAYAASQRARETAIRMALGATRASLIRQFLRETAATASVGMILGVAATAALSRVVAAIIGNTSALEPVAIAASALLLSGALGIASVVPALRASNADPLRALRIE
ncbi:MAG: ADOP family duplicated permease [Acidobacteriota bacterium]|nr:ADOP family duplicated permease [Acidobacteriota bacterium]